jgi:glyoxylase-like metal-dependent hydrolase (beta-lactamase superfamily II)
MNHMLPYYSVPRRPQSAKARVVRNLDVCNDAGLTYIVCHTPGHSPGSVCFHFQKEGVLFSGDTLFAGSVGRTDLPGGSSKLMSESLSSLSKLPRDTKIYPGHGPSTIMLRELETNPFLA